MPAVPSFFFCPFSPTFFPDSPALDDHDCLLVRGYGIYEIELSHSLRLYPLRPGIGPPIPKKEITAHGMDQSTVGTVYPFR
jgi:hypothetical protein